MANAIPTIDRMPEAERKKVLDALISGQTLRSISRMTGLSTQAISKYKKKVVLPALRASTYLPNSDQLVDNGQSRAFQHGTVAKDIVRTSPFRDRVESLWQRSAALLDRAEAAASTAQEIASVSTLLNQAHKNLELLGKYTGELEQQATGPSVAIQIVCPAGGGSPRVTGDDALTIDVGGVEIGLKPGR